MDTLTFQVLWHSVSWSQPAAVRCGYAVQLGHTIVPVIFYLLKLSNCKLSL